MSVLTLVTVMLVAGADLQLGAGTLPNHFEPVAQRTSPPHGYHGAIERVLFAHGHHDVEMLVVPSFDSEVAVSIVRTARTERSGVAGDVVVRRVGLFSIHGKHNALVEQRYPMRHLPKQHAYVGTATAEQREALWDEVVVDVEVDVAPIAAELLADLETLWNLALDDARVPEVPPIGADGYTVTISDVGADGKLREAHAWSPEDPGTKTRAVTDVGFALIGYASAPPHDRAASLRVLSKATDAALALWQR